MKYLNLAFLCSFLFISCNGVSNDKIPSSNTTPSSVVSNSNKNETTTQIAKANANKQKLELTYAIPDTNVKTFYNNLSSISTPDKSNTFYYQDASFSIHPNSYNDNKDGTITDNVTGLTWQKEMGEKMTLEEAKAKLSKLNNESKEEWRIPSIKELYSLIDYNGQVFGDKSVKFFINTTYFNQPLGNNSLGEREIDAQTWTITESKSLTMGRDHSYYGVNFVDGRVKAYPVVKPMNEQNNKLYFRFVKGNKDYGKNNFIDNNDGTISDLATGLMWQKKDNGEAIDWENALNYAKNLTLANHKDWRVPSIKELQSIVDYDIDFQSTQKAGINELFEISKRNDPDGSLNYPFYWSSTTLLDGPSAGNMAAYVCFGRSTAKFMGSFVNAHGLGAVRSDPKTGDPANYPRYFGPQGDIQYAANFVRCVRNIK